MTRKSEIARLRRDGWEIVRLTNGLWYIRGPEEPQRIDVEVEQGWPTRTAAWDALLGNDSGKAR